MKQNNTKLSKRDLDTLRCIREFMLKNNVTPTVREICEGLGIRSTSSAFIHLKRLQEWGYIIPYGDTGRYSVKGLRITEVLDEQ